MTRRPSTRALAIGAAALAGAALLDRYNRRTVRRGLERFPAGGDFLEIDGVRLHHVRRGAGVPVLFFHGAGGTLHEFDRVTPLLTDGCETIAFDRPGHGYSDPLAAVGRGGVAAQADFFARLARRLGLDRPILVGYSWAAALVLEHALRYPEETGAVVLLGGTTHEGEPSNNPLYWLLRTPGLRQLVIRLGLVPIGYPYIRLPLARAFAPDPLLPDYLERARATWVQPKSVRAMTRDFSALEPTLRRVRAHLGELRVPVVAVSGERDRLVDPSRNTLLLGREMPAAEVMMVPGAGHALPHTRPEAVARAVRRAAQLRGRRPAPGSSTP